MVSHCPVAIKIFSPDRYDDERAYDDAMQRIADVAAHVAQIQHDNLLDVQNFVDRNRIRMMVMEWVDGYDLEKLLVPERSGASGIARQPEALGVHQPRDRHGRSGPSAVQSRAWPWRSCAAAWARWRPCTAKASCTATSSRRT